MLNSKKNGNFKPQLHPNFNPALNTFPSVKFGFENLENNPNISHVTKFESGAKAVSFQGDPFTKTTAKNQNDVSSKPAPRGKPSSRVFVASLCHSKTDEELSKAVFDRFKAFGEILSTKVLRDSENRPYAFVQYTNENDCVKAIENGNRITLHGRLLRCEKAKVNRTLFVKFPHALNKADCLCSMMKFGEIEDTVVSDQYGTLVEFQREFGYFWFVQFVYREDAIKAYAGLVGNKKYHAEWAQNIDSTTFGQGINFTSNFRQFKHSFDKYAIFIGKLSKDTTEDDLNERFSKHGEISHIHLCSKPENDTNFAFIKYVSESGPASAVEIENHTMIKGKTIHVQYKEHHKHHRNSNFNKSSKPLHGKYLNSSVPVKNKPQNVKFKEYGHDLYSPVYPAILPEKIYNLPDTLQSSLNNTFSTGSIGSRVSYTTMATEGYRESYSEGEEGYYYYFPSQ